MTDYIVHKAVEPDAVQKKFRKPLDEMKRTYMVQPKYDGCCAVVKLYDEDTQDFVVLTRTGETIFSMDHLAIELARTQSLDLVFIGEAYKRGLPQATISGMVRQHSPAPDLDFVVFDILTRQEFEAGFSPAPFRERIKRFAGEFPAIHDPARKVRLANTFKPGLMDPDFLLTQLMADGGYDGIILRDPEGMWTAGRGTTGEIIKIKPTLTFDLEIIGVEEGKGKLAGKVGKVLFRWHDDRTVKAIGGSHDDLTAWFNDPSLIVGKIGEIECMALTENGIPREPRFKGVRFDKLHADA